MNSLMDIWNEILHKLSSQLTPTAINTWFSDCEPVDLEELTQLLGELIHDAEK